MTIGMFAGYSGNFRWQAPPFGEGSRRLPVDGKEAVTFLIRIKDCIENPTRLMLEM